MGLDKIKRYFNSQVTQLHKTGQHAYKVKESVTIEGMTYHEGELVPISIVDQWSRTNEPGSPRSDKNPEDDIFKDIGDPDDDTSDTYPSPLKDNNAYWCWSVENEALIASTITPKFVVPVGDIFTSPASNVSNITYQAIKEKFSYNRSTPFRFNRVSHAAVREIQDAVVAHIRKTSRADQSYSLYNTFKSEFKQDLVLRLRRQLIQGSSTSEQNFRPNVDFYPFSLDSSRSHCPNTSW